MRLWRCGESKGSAWVSAGQGQCRSGLVCVLAGGAPGPVWWDCSDAQPEPDSAGAFAPAPNRRRVGEDPGRPSSAPAPPPAGPRGTRRPGSGVFECLDELGADIGSVRAFAFCEGPGSILGIRTSAMALRAWNVLRPRPMFGYFEPGRRGPGPRAAADGRHRGRAARPLAPLARTAAPSSACRPPSSRASS